jgi:hypothetical protein
LTKSSACAIALQSKARGDPSFMHVQGAARVSGVDS